MWRTTKARGVIGAFRATWWAMTAEEEKVWKVMASVIWTRTSSVNCSRKSEDESDSSSTPVTSSRDRSVQGSGFRVQGAGFRVQGAGFRVQGAGFRVARVQGAGRKP